MTSTVVVSGPIPKRRGRWSRRLRRIVCWLRGGHPYRAWLAPPGMMTLDGEQGFRMARCKRCGSEFIDHSH